MTADVYGNGAADEKLAHALEGFPRHSYAPGGDIGHDFYKGERAGSKGYPRFTDPALRTTAKDYADYIQMATERMLERCRVEKFDCLMLHNPDSIGYTSDAVWKGMERMREQKLTELLGIAPGPANGYTLDVIQSFERFGPLLDWAMVILNPLEPWPGELCLPAAEKHDVKVITRVVDYGGLFHDDVKPGHEFAKYDHRTYRAAGWVETGTAKLEKMRGIAEKHGLTMLQLACIWNLWHGPVKSVVQTITQEIGANAKSMEGKIDELAQLPEVTFDEDEIEELRRIGDNTNCMDLKGANPGHTGESTADRWGLTNDLTQVAQRWHIEPAKDLICTHTAAPVTA